MSRAQHDPNLDLAFSRHVALPAEALWAAWTQPDLLMPWFCPKPWQTVACEIDLQPGGIFRTVMRSPHGQEHVNSGCYLVVEPNRRLVWTNALAPGFRPLPPNRDGDDFLFTGEIALMPIEAGLTRYEARVSHATLADCDKHAAMGFEKGWSVALDQLIEFMRLRQAAAGQ
ncbi:MAG: polyketide cyclase [Rhodocyclales bacterium GT-UBC]|nr:MAG: polyketide cyclase [Rhodocyclales bacterium GT-UBC]